MVDYSLYSKYIRIQLSLSQQQLQLRNSSCASRLDSPSLKCAVSLFPLAGTRSTNDS